MSEIFLTFTNSVDPDEMQHYVPFHLGLHCLPKYAFRSHYLRNITIARLWLDLTCIIDQWDASGLGLSLHTVNLVLVRTLE